MSSQILLYTGKGAGPFCSGALKNQMEKLLDNSIYKVNEIKTFANCIPDPSSINAIFVPGGNAAEMLINLTSDAKSSLKELFTKYHSSYYGACAGGIFASSGCFETALNVAGDLRCIKTISYPLLEIFPGKVVAPIFPKPVQGKLSVNDFRLLNIQLTSELGQKILATHILSPGYLDVKEVPGAEILSTYETHSPIRYAAENGAPGLPIEPKNISESLFYDSGSCRMILTGSHLEVNSKAIFSQNFKTAFSATVQSQEKLGKQMEVDDLAREALLKLNFERIGLRCFK